ncbi:ATP-binding cassette domain-containing protein [Nocardioides hungaricus]
MTKCFGGVTALSDVTLEVTAGSALGVIGPNGAGKSTLLKLVAGADRPTSGSIWYGHQDLRRVPAHKFARLGISLAHQVPRPFRGLTVADNVEIGAAAARLPKNGHANWVHEVLETCRLGHRRDTPAAELQLLDLKRLELARALSTDPALILLDEVAAGLNGRELDEIIALIDELKRQGRGLVLVEHVEGVISSLVDRVVVIDWGKVIADGSPAAVAVDERVRAVYLGDGVPQASATTVPAGSGGATVSAPASGHTHAAPGDGPAALRLNSISTAHGDVEALRDLDLVVRPGEVVAVFGANGAGKSTLVSTISGRLAPRTGSILFEGADITRVPAHTRNRLGIAHCPEGRHIFADLTVRENLEIAASLRTPRRKLAELVTNAYDVFPSLADIDRRSAGALSGGQQQMLAIGRALMSEPRMLLCDEISLGLAPLAIDALYDALRRISQANVSILLVEQNVHRGLALASRVYVLDRGRSVYSGDPAPLADPATLNHLYFGTSGRQKPKSDLDAQPESNPLEGLHL